MNKLKLGQIVQITSGREAGSYAVVVRMESPGVIWLADGRSRLESKPKKKNLKHVQITHAVGVKVARALEKGVLTNADLRSDLNQYLRQKDVY